MSVVIESERLKGARGLKVCSNFDGVLMISKKVFCCVHDCAASFVSPAIPRVGFAQTLQSRRPPTGKGAAGWFPWWLQPPVVCPLALDYQVVLSRVVGKGPRSSERPRSKHRHEGP